MKAFLKKLIQPWKAEGGFLAAADCLRVLCVLTVMWYHIWQQSWLRPAMRIGTVWLEFEGIVRAGYMAVDLLLMLSGFLLFLPWARCRFFREKTPSLKEYYRKRAARILPSYLACIFIVLFCFALPGGEYGSVKHMLTDLRAHLTFTHNLFPQAYQGTRLNGALWTLAVEVQFYLIAPFLCRAFMKRPGLTYGAMTLIAFLYRFCFVLPMENASMYVNRLPAMLDAYANGMMGAYVYVFLCRRMKRTSVRAAAMTLLSVLCLMGIYRLIAGQSMVSGGQPAMHAGQLLRRFPLTALGSLFLASASLGLGWAARLICARPVRWLSMISYNVYIWHVYAAQRLKEWRIPPYSSDAPNMSAEQPWQIHYTLICFLSALLIGALATYFIEKPGARLIAGGKRRSRA